MWNIARSESRPNLPVIQNVAIKLIHDVNCVCVTCKAHKSAVPELATGHEKVDVPKTQGKLLRLTIPPFLTWEERRGHTYRGPCCCWSLLVGRKCICLCLKSTRAASLFLEPVASLRQAPIFSPPILVSRSAALRRISSRG